MASDTLGLLDSAPCGFLSFTDEGRIVLVNATLADRLDLVREEVIGSSVENLFPLATRLFYQTHFFPLVRMQGSAQEVFLLLRTQSGDDVGMLCNARRGLRDGAAVTDCVLMEVIERRKYEDALLNAKRAAEQANAQLEEQALELEMQHQQLQEQATELEVQSDALQSLNDELVARTTDLERAQTTAERANRAKSDFLATMSHELRTPLNAIGGYTDLLTTGIYGPVTAQQREALDRVRRAQRHLLGLINDILNLARVEAGRVEYRISRVAVGDVVGELAAMIEPQVAAKQQLYTAPAHDCPIAVCADHERLVQILLNLLSNAVKFTEPGGKITLACESTSGIARFTVTDTGRGIPGDKLESVFEPFVQVRADQTTPNEGTGLGLAISRNLARGMGGDLSATSTVGVGSAFALTVPLAGE